MTTGSPDFMDNGKLRGFEVEAGGMAILAAHSLDGVLIYERDVKEYAKDPETGLAAVHVRGVEALRKLAALASAVADYEEGRANGK